ncbi:MAG: F0F1 ATP synthase subunit B [Desulfotomaculaceae bacterium]|nr:F0F1 ATP synthase subunit B [Desulfotomaculaceae bacterium]
MENFPNGTLIGQIINFLILLFLLKKFAFKPLGKLLSDRQQLIADSITTAEQERQQAEQIKAEYEAEMQRTREMAQEIIQKATKAGEEQAAEIIESAKNEAKRLKDAALVEIKHEKEKAVAEMRDEAATLAILVAGKIINQQIDEDIQHKMVKDFVKEAGELLC